MNSAHPFQYLENQSNQKLYDYEILSDFPSNYYGSRIYNSAELEMGPALKTCNPLVCLLLHLSS